MRRVREPEFVSIEPASSLTRGLLAKLRAGDLEAERRLFSRFRAALLERARTHARMRPLARDCSAEDAVQEVFTRTLTSGMLRRFEDRGPGSLQAALNKVLDNTLVDMGRRIATQKRGGRCARIAQDASGSPATLDRIASEDTTPTSRARAEELVELARRALSARDFGVWHALEIEGHDAPELAARMGVSASSVRGLLFRARRRLIEVLGSERDGPEGRS